MFVSLWEYAQIAAQVYNDAKAFMLPGWECQRFKMDKPFFKGGDMSSDGFQGGSFYNGALNHLVFGFKGTVPAMATDLAADWQIMCQRIPDQCNTAMGFVENWSSTAPADAKISLVGHSLGGGICQILGSWNDLPFVTFNAPGMGTNWAFAHIRPGNLARTWKARRRDDGVNYRLLNDPVSKLGNHIGRVVKIDAGLGVLKAHFMDSVLGAIALKGRSFAFSDPFAT